VIFLGIAITLVVLFLASVLRLFLSRFTTRTFSQVIPFLRRDDAANLAELLDRAMESHLAEVLSHSQFRKEQLNRIRLVHERIECRAHNVKVWQEWADTELSRSRITGNQEIQAVADELVVACAEFRIGVSAVQTQLRIWQFQLVILRFARVPRVSSLRKIDEFDLLESYESIQHVALRLAELCGGDYYDQLLEAF
jgi:hypothetical protein